MAHPLDITQGILAIKRLEPKKVIFSALSIVIYYLLAQHFGRIYALIL